MDHQSAQFYFSNQDKWVGLVICLLCLLGAVLILRGTLPLDDFPVSGNTIALGLAVFSGVGLWLLIPKLKQRKLAMTLSPEGIWLLQYQSMGTIPWSEIGRMWPETGRLAADGSTTPSTAVLINLRHPEAWTRKVEPPMAQKVVRLAQQLTGATISIDCSQLASGAPKKPYAMLELLQDWQKRYWVVETLPGSVADLARRGALSEAPEQEQQLEDETDSGDKYLHHQFGRDESDTTPPQPGLL